MADALDKKAVLRQNLMDAGCSQEITKLSMELAEAGQEEQLKNVLSVKKQELLNSVHTGQQQIDCLDYLVYQIEKGNI